MAQKASRPLLPHDRIEQILEMIALLPEAQQPIMLAEACDLLESPANTQPLLHISIIELLAAYTERGSEIEKRLQGLWEKANIEYARRGKPEKQATQTSMNEWIRDPNSQWAEPAAKVYCIVTYGHPRELWDRLKAFGRRAMGSHPEPMQ